MKHILTWAVLLVDLCGIVLATLYLTARPVALDVWCLTRDALPAVGLGLAGVGVAAILIYPFVSHRVDRPIKRVVSMGNRGGPREQELLERLAVAPEPYNQYRLGSLYVSTYREREAIPHLEASVSGDPSRVDAWYQLGLARLHSGDPAGAVKALEEARSKNPKHDYGALLLRLGDALMAQSLRSEAEAIYSQLLDAYPGNPEALYWRGIVRYEQGRAAEARADHEMLMKEAAAATDFQRKQARSWARRARLFQLSSLRKS